jgi:hypothetical protein
MRQHLFQSAINKQIKTEILIHKKPKNYIRCNKYDSNFQGVAKNGDKWQVTHFVNLKKFDVGSFGCIMIAAIVSDVL